MHKGKGRAFRKLNNWKINDKPIYFADFWTPNGKAMLEEAMKCRPWWGTASWQKEEHCTLLWSTYKRPDHCNLIRSRSAHKKAQKKNNEPHISPQFAYNHLEWNRWLTSKKGLYLSLDLHCKRTGQTLESFTPKTFYLQTTEESQEMKKFADYVHKLATDGDSENTTISEDPADRAGGKNFWIIKPAAGSNRGDGIRILAGKDVVDQVKRIIESGGEKDVQGGKGGERGWKLFGWIVQKYIERPLLIHNRKFDLRCYVLIVLAEDGSGSGDSDSGNGVTAYLYDEGYLRTSSTPYVLSDSPEVLADTKIHLTNDAVQNKVKSNKTANSSLL